MAKQTLRNRKLTPEEAAKYQEIREKIDIEKPQFIAKAQRARRDARRRQPVSIKGELKAAREAKGFSLAVINHKTGIDRSVHSKLEYVTNENPTVDTLLRYAEAVGKQVQIEVLDRKKVSVKFVVRNER